MSECTIVCFMCEGLDELPRRYARSLRCVALFLVKSGRFSVFEATSTSIIANTLDRVFSRGWFETDPTSPFPWVRVSLTAKGRRALGIADGGAR